MNSGGALATLRHRNFQLLWLGQLISAVGDQMQIVAIAWHVYLLTGSALDVGIIGVFRLLPFIVLSLLGGAFADVADRKKIILVAALVQLVATGGLAAAVYTGHVSIWLLYAITFISGAATAFDQPARTALVANVVPRDEMSNAFTLLIVLRQISQIAGPGLGGVAIAVLGLGTTYLANGASFLAVVAALLLMGPVAMERAQRGGGWERILAGFQFARRDRLIMLPLGMDVGTRLFVSSRPLLPILAGSIFGMGATGLGWLNMAPSVGALVGGVLLGSSRQTKHPLRLIVAAFAAEGLFVMGLGGAVLLARNSILGGFALAMLVLFGAGVADVLNNVPRTTIVQMRTPDELRGRVSALMSVFSSTGPQLGQVEMGGLAVALGPVLGPLVSGFVATAIPLCCLIPERLRHDVAGFTLDADSEP
jgi:MFS family permease